jgi:hypothetical protein
MRATVGTAKLARRSHPRLETVEHSTRRLSPIERSRDPLGAAWLAAAAACGLVIGAFTRIGLALAVLLERRFPFSRPDPQLPLDGIIAPRVLRFWGG